MLSTLILLAACGIMERVPVEPCTGTCIIDIEAVTDNLLLLPGDAARIWGEARTADGEQVSLRWAAGNSLATVGADGHVTAVAAGRSWTTAIPVSGEMRGTRSDIWIVHPDTSAQPFITLFRNAANGDTLYRRRGFLGVDSIDVAVSYVLGRTTQTLGAPAITFAIRAWDKPADLATTLLPLTERGKVGTVVLRVRLTEKLASGARRFPIGHYNFFLLLPLADGRVLGSGTGYPVQF
ncbi:MAG: hypothetical protein H7Z40_04650 [Phycisphaerae bacterium]|nr:hypothetical protein [Gemmatimonadaceae bacterium]